MSSMLLVLCLCFVMPLSLTSAAELVDGDDIYDLAVVEEYKTRRPEPPLEIQDVIFNFNGVENVKMNSALTGEHSQSSTRTRFGVHGTDIGAAVTVGDQTLYLFGDTFSQKPQGGRWRSNFLAFSTDTDPTDGIYLDRVYEHANKTNFIGSADEIVKSQAWYRENGGLSGGRYTVRLGEMNYSVSTSILTGGFYIEETDTIYVTYMAINRFGNAGQWFIEFGSMVKSEDGGDTWDFVYDVYWEGNLYRWYNSTSDNAYYNSISRSIGFEQLCPVDGNDGYIYFFGIPGGRFGASKLMRAPYAGVEVQDSYEYLTGYEEDGSPIWKTQAEGGLVDAIVINIPGPIGEMSVMYSDYLGEWLITYLEEFGDYLGDWGSMRMVAAKELWGPYSVPQHTATHDTYPQPYGAFMIPTYQSADSSKIYYVMSLWGNGRQWNDGGRNPVGCPGGNHNAEGTICPVCGSDGLLYNTFVMEMDLVKREIVDLETTKTEFVSMVETSPRVWTLSFYATKTYSDGQSVRYLHSIDLPGNNANQDGKVALDGEYKGFTLVYDIKGNGSNIKALAFLLT